MSRTPFIAANWKMNPPPAGWDKKDSPYRATTECDVVIFPTFLDIPACVEAGLKVGAQYGRPEVFGPFTGDISVKMLAARGVKYILCGHSERRINHHETDNLISAQVQAAISEHIICIICVGETEEERKDSKAKVRIEQQLKAINQKLDASNCIIAYEPVWAIGNGCTASAEDAQEMHAYIRSLLPAECRNAIRIIYGGSVRPENAEEILSQPDIDGALVGKSSLDPEMFGKVVKCAK